MNNYKLTYRIILACCMSIYIAYGFVLPARANSWDSVYLAEMIPIEKIIPSRDGAYFLSKPAGSPTDEANRNLAYWSFYDRKYSYLSLGNGYIWKFLDCELTREGYLAVGFAYGDIAYFSGAAELTGFGSFGVSDCGLEFMDIVVTNEQSMAFFFNEGAYRVTGEKYNNLEVINGPRSDWFMCDGHNGTFWAATRWPESTEFLFERINQETVSRQIRLEGMFRGFFCDNADTLWIATSRGLYWMPSNVQIDNQQDYYNPGIPILPKELVLCPSYPGPPPTSVVCDGTGRTLVGTDGDGLYLYDRKTWAHISLTDGIADMDIRCVGVDPDNRFYAAGNGWFSCEKESPVVVKENHQTVPLMVHPPYPNPANAAVTIGYTLNHDAPVRFEIFNMLGQTVMERSEERMMAGFHQSTFTTNDMASGLYLLHIEADGYHSFAKITVMK